MKCRAQAKATMRQQQSSLRLLLRMQAARKKTEADSAACDRAAWTEHCAISLMAEALSPQAASETLTEPQPPRQSEPAPAEQLPAPLAEAEQYAAIYPHRAALIRRLGRVPDNSSFDPPNNDLIQTLITARTPAFTTLDRQFAEFRAA